MSRKHTVPLCWYCEHAHEDPYWQRTCDAFPRGIPDLIYGEHDPDMDVGAVFRYDHREPLAGDNDIQFKPKEGLSEEELIGLDMTIDELMIGRIMGDTLPRLGK